MKLLDFVPSFSPRVRLVTVEQCWAVGEASHVAGPYEAGVLLVPYFRNKDREHLVVLHLDSAHRPTSVEVVSVGTLTSALVHPREVYKSAILANARAIIVAHNHPSGNAAPSDEDSRVYKKLKAAGDLLEIPLLDFLIVAGDKAHSIKDHWAFSESE